MFVNGDGVFGDGFVIDGDGERDVEFVGARVSFVDGNCGGVEFGVDIVCG